MEFLDKLSSRAHWFLRIAVSMVALYHGIGKFPTLELHAAMAKVPVFMILLTAFVEIISGALILLGGALKDWMTRLGALMLMPVLVAAIALVHWPKWSFVCTPSHPWGGMEFQVTLLLILFYLFVKGNHANAGVANPKP